MSTTHTFEESTSSLEEDPIIAAVVADAFNQLIDQKYITPENVDKASDQQMIEILSRWGDILETGLNFEEPASTDTDRIAVAKESSPIIANSIHTLLSGNHDPKFEAKREGEITELESVFRQILTDLAHNHPEFALEGVMLFGSRVDIHKNPREDSDYDFILITDKKFSNEEFNELSNIAGDGLESVLNSRVAIKSMQLQELNEVISNPPYLFLMPDTVRIVGVSPKEEATLKSEIISHLDDPKRLQAQKAFIDQIRDRIRNAVLSQNS